MVLTALFHEKTLHLTMQGLTPDPLGVNEMLYQLS